MRVRIAGAVMLVVCLAESAVAEEVTLSRYREKKFAPDAVTMVVPLDMSAFRDRCLDDDGCEVSLFVKTVTVATGATHGRMYLRDFNEMWVTTAGVQAQDGDGITATAAKVTVGAATCELSDASPTQAFDAGVGFTLIVYGGIGGAQCALTAIE